MCAACQPGYRPTFDAAKGVTACTLIPNCDSSAANNIFNKCSKCQMNFAFRLSDNVVDQGVCVPSNDPNCLAVDSIFACQLCNPGFALNKD